MGRRPFRAAVGLAAALTSCASAPVSVSRTGPADTALPSPSSSLSPERAVALPEGLRFARSTTAPPTIRWARSEAFEAVASDGTNVYVVGERITAYDLATGRTRWRVSLGEVDISGGVQIGPAGAGQVEVFAPFGIDAVVDIASGEPVRIDGESVGDDPPPGFVAYPAPEPTCWKVDSHVEFVRATHPDGTTAWRIDIEEPMDDEGEAFQIGDAVVLPLASGDVLAVDCVAAP